MHREENRARTLVNSPADSKTRYALDGKSSKPHLDVLAPLPLFAANERRESFPVRRLAHCWGTLSPLPPRPRCRLRLAVCLTGGKATVEAYARQAAWSE
jgi:hypothetical protein